MFESLETRRMLSTVVAKFDDGAYVVKGSEQKDHIHIVVDTFSTQSSRPVSAAAKLTGSRLGSGGGLVSGAEARSFSASSSIQFVASSMVFDRVRVFDETGLIASTVQPAGSVREVNVLAGGGTDVVRVDNNGSGARVSIAGGDDDDYIDSNAARGAAGSFVNGGAGNDLIRLSVQKGTEGHLVYGEAGSDTIHGSESNDRLFGDNPLAANDPAGADGDDAIFGNDGNDTLVGAEGADRLFGGAGDDLLDGQLGADKMDGGDGTDTAAAREPHDELISIERISGEKRP
jgi:Ca2+-binding RTX toxin-like protein